MNEWLIIGGIVAAYLWLKGDSAAAAAPPYLQVNPALVQANTTAEVQAAVAASQQSSTAAQQTALPAEYANVYNTTLPRIVGKVQDASGQRLAGKCVDIIDEIGRVIGNSFTDGNGVYHFGGLDLGRTYEMRIADDYQQLRPDR